MTNYPPPPPPPGAVPPPSPAPSRKPFYKKPVAWAIGIVGIIAIAVAANGSDKKGDGASSSSSAARPPAANGSITSQVAPTSTAAPTSGAAPELKTVLSEKGSGIRDTKSFTVSSDEWQVSYSYDCSNFGQAGIFQIYLYDGADDNSLTDVIANESKTKGKATQTEHGTGKYYFKVNSTCDWTVKVKG